MKTRTIRFIVTRKPIVSSTGVTSLPEASSAASTKRCGPTSAKPASTLTTMIASVASGPAPATSSSSRGVRLSRLISAKPPSGEIVMPATSIPWRRAASAWPSSCTTIEANSSSALATAVR